MKPLRKNLFLQKAILLALFPSFVWLPVATYANPNPDGANIISGEISFELDGDTLNILQSSKKSIIEWDDFSIGEGQSTIFQMGRTGASLNRVTGAGISSLNGLLEADGTVWLINPNGIIQGPNGMIDVGGLLLSTLDVSNDVFLNGGDVLLQGNSQASIITNGTIQAADGGEIYVVAHNIEINGAIGGIDNRVVLARGGEVLIEQGRGGNVFVTGAVGMGHITVGETGTVEGAEAILASTGNAMSMAVQNRGTIRANSSDRSGGRILLRADNSGIESTGVVDASGTVGGDIDIIADGAINIGGMVAANGETTAGSVDIIGSTVDLMPDATVSAAGELGGGAINIGSDGTDPLLPTTSSIAMAPGSTVNVGATVGDAGAVKLTATGEVVVGGAIAAVSRDGAGGTASIAGGNINITPTGSVDVSGVSAGSVSAMAQSNLTSAGQITANGTTGAGGMVDLTAGDNINILGGIQANSSEGLGGSVTASAQNVNVGLGANISANGESGGSVALDASDQMNVDGTVSAIGNSGSGGLVNLTGNEVSLGANAVVDVTGATDGGFANIGGGFQGNDPNLRNAQNTNVAMGAVVRASGGTGNGGQVAVWADGATDFRGSIDVSGAVDGGLAEVSGLGSLKFSGNVIASGETGADGTLLLDPVDVLIDDGTSGISAASIVTALGSSNVVIHTSGTGAEPGDITIAHQSHVDFQSPNSISFFAHGDFILDGSASVRNGGIGNVNVVAGWSGGGVGLFTNNATTDALGGQVQSAGDISVADILANTYGTWGTGGQGNVVYNAVSDDDTVATIASAHGETNVFGNDLTMFTASTRNSAQLGWNMHELDRRIDDGDVNLRALNLDTSAVAGATGKGMVGNTALGNANAGDINVYMQGNIILLSNNESATQIGHGGYEDNRQGGMPDADAHGNITVRAGGALIMQGSTNRGSSMIGHGGVVEDWGGAPTRHGDKSGNIDVEANSIVMTSGGTGSSVQIGHGGHRNDGNMTGDVRVIAENSIFGSQNDTDGRRGYIQIGHGGIAILDRTTQGQNNVGTGLRGNDGGTATGDVTVRGSSITMIGGNDHDAWAQIGHGGYNVRGAHSGNIDVVATTGNIEMLASDDLSRNAGRDRSYAMIGHGGYNSSSPEAWADTQILVRQYQVTNTGGTAFYFDTTTGLVSTTQDATYTDVVAAGTPLWYDPTTGEVVTSPDGIDDVPIFDAQSVYRDPTTGQLTVTPDTVDDEKVADVSSEILYVPLTLQNDRGDRDTLLYDEVRPGGDLTAVVNLDEQIVLANDPDGVGVGSDAYGFATDGSVGGGGRVMREVNTIGTPLDWQQSVDTQLGTVLDSTGNAAADGTPLYIHPQTGRVLPYASKEAAAADGYVRWDGQAFQQYADSSGGANTSNPTGNTALYINPNTGEILPEGDAGITADFIAHRQGLSGTINVNAENGAVIFRAGSGNYNFAKVGHGGIVTRAADGNGDIYNGSATGGDLVGNVTVNAGNGNITFDRILETDVSATHGSAANYGRGSYSYVQVGHGSYEGAGNYIGDIVANATGDVEMYAGRERAYAMLGHGGDGGDTWSRTPAIDMNANGIRDEGNGTTTVNTVSYSEDFDFDGDGTDERDQRPNYRRVSAIRGTFSGDISVNAGGDVTFRSGFRGNRAFSQVGHGGYNMMANANEGHNGDINIVAGGDVDFAAGAIEELNPEGDEIADGLLRPGQGTLEVNQEHNGNDNFTMIGHGGRVARGDHWGLINVSVTGDFRMQATGGWDGIEYENQASTPTSGTGGGNDNRNVGRPLYNTTGQSQSTGDRNFAQLGHGGHDSEARLDSRNGANSQSGSASRGMGVLGASDITLTAGGDVSLIAAQTNQLYNNGIGDARSAPGNRFYETGQIDEWTVEVQGGAAGLAADDHNVTIDLPAPVQSARESYAMIGHGGRSTEIQSIFIDDGHKGDITVSANGLIDVRAGDFVRGIEPSSQVGAWEVIISDPDLSQDYEINAGRGSLDVQDNFAKIGHGGNYSNNGTLEGIISVTSTGFFDALNANTAQIYTLADNRGNLVDGMGLSLQGGNGNRSYAMIGHGGYDDQRSQYIDPIVNNFGGGNGANRGLRVDADGNFIPYGYNDGGTEEYNAIGGTEAWVTGTGGRVDQGKSKSYLGDVTIDVNGGIDMLAGIRNHSFAMVGHGGYGHVNDTLAEVTVNNADISVTAQQGDLTLQGGPNVATQIRQSNQTQIYVGRDANGTTNIRNGEQRWVRIGHGGIQNDMEIDASISVSAALGDVNVLAGDHRLDMAQIGHGGSYMDGGPNLDTDLIAGDISVLAGGDVTVRGGDAPSTSDWLIPTDPSGNQIFTEPAASWLNEFASYGMIGHGGYQSGASNRGISYDGNITIDALGVKSGSDGDVTAEAGDGDFAFALIGHGGARSESIGTITGDVVVNSANDVTLRGGERYANTLVSSTINFDTSLYNSSNFAQIGHSANPDDARRTGNTDGNISVAALNNITLDGGGGYSAYAIIGNASSYYGGSRIEQGLFDRPQIGDHSGDINVIAGNNLFMESGNRFEEDVLSNVAKGVVLIADETANPGAGGGFAVAQIGNGGPGTIGSVVGMSGDINVVVGNDLIMNTGDGGITTPDGLGGDTAGTAGGAGQNAYVKIGHGDYMFSNNNESGTGFREGNINVAVGEDATINGGQIGHADSSISSALAIEGDTFIAVGRNNPFIEGAGTLTTRTVDVQSGPVDSPTTRTVLPTFSSGLISELRIYLPNRTPNDTGRDLPIGPDLGSELNSNRIANGTRLNGTSYTNPSGEAFQSSFSDNTILNPVSSVAKLRTSDELYAAEFQFTDSVSGDPYVSPQGGNGTVVGGGTPTGGLPTGGFTPAAGEDINGLLVGYRGGRGYTVYYAPPGALLPGTPGVGGGGGRGGDGGLAIVIGRGKNAVLITLPPNVKVVSNDSGTQTLVGLSPTQQAAVDAYLDPNTEIYRTSDEWNRIVNPEDTNSTATAGEVEGESAVEGSGDMVLEGEYTIVRVPRRSRLAGTVQTQSASQGFRIYSMNELYSMQQGRQPSGSTGTVDAAPVVSDPFAIPTQPATQDDEELRRREGDGAPAAEDPFSMDADTPAMEDDPFSF